MLNRSINSKIFSVKVADTQTDRQTDMATDNKGRLKLSSCASQLLARWRHYRVKLVVMSRTVDNK